MVAASAGIGRWWDSLNVETAVLSFSVVTSWMVTARVVAGRGADGGRVAGGAPIVAAALSLCVGVGFAQRPALLAAGAGAVALFVALAGRLDGGRGGSWFEPVLLVMSNAAIFVAVPDTEVAVIVGGGLVPTVLATAAHRGAGGGGAWSRRATGAWIVCLVVAAVDGGWGRSEGLAALACLAVPLAAVSARSTTMKWKPATSVAVALAHLALSLFAARRVSRWEVVDVRWFIAGVAILTAAAVYWGRRRADASGSSSAE